MHLFIHHQTSTITDSDRIHQITRVLRMRIGDFFVVQTPDGMRRETRKITTIEPKCIQTELLETVFAPELKGHLTMFIAMPNKFDKAELIVQKLTEIGVDRIVFRPATRSQLHELPEKKIERLYVIAKEATEQSRGWHIPEITRTKTLDCLGFDECFLVDYHTGIQIPIVHCGKEQIAFAGIQRCGIVGPEGGFHPDEYTYFQTMNNCKQAVLGSNVLRMETAAITAAWWLCTGKSKMSG